MYKLDEEDIKYIKKNKNFSYSVVEDVEITKNRFGYEDVKVIKSKGKCYCSVSKEREFYGDRCPYCYGRTTEVYPSSLGIKNRHVRSKYETLKSFYVKTIENGIAVFEYSLGVKITKRTENKAEEYVKIHHIIVFKLGEKPKAYKVMAKELKDSDLFEALRINTQTLQNDVDVLYQNSISLIDFLLKNKDFAKKTGAIEFLNFININIPQNIRFLLYIYILSEYPSVELLIKMGYIKLIASMFNKLTNCSNKENIKHEVSIFNTLIKDSKKGSDCLMLPKYAADYLNEIDADFDLFDIWSTFFSYENMSKEQFLKAIYQIGCTDIPIYQISKLTDVIKYGYTIEKLCNYMNKQAEKLGITCYYVLQILEDYLRMCSLMGETIDLYPSNVITSHDNIQLAFKTKENECTNISLKEISKNCSKYIPKHDEYTIIIPDSIEAFVREGQNQHNCVASYINSVTSKVNIVFFIRKKDEPDKSFITAEYKNGYLAQIRSRNNNPVYKTDIIDYANDFCKKLETNIRKIYS